MIDTTFWWIFGAILLLCAVILLACGITWIVVRGIPRPYPGEPPVNRWKRPRASR